jgi:hypothetical protein
MRIDYQKYEAASDRLTGLSATLEKQRQRVNDIRRELALTEMAASPAEVVVALQEAGDGLSAICADYAQRHNALGHAMKSLAQTELEHGESQATVNRMRSFIASFNNVSTAMPRIV